MDGPGHSVDRLCRSIKRNYFDIYFFKMTSEEEMYIFFRVGGVSSRKKVFFIGKAVFICLVGSVNLVMKFQGMFFSAGWTPQNYST